LGIFGILVVVSNPLAEQHPDEINKKSILKKITVQPIPVMHEMNLEIYAVLGWIFYCIFKLMLVSMGLFVFLCLFIIKKVTSLLPNDSQTA